MDHTIIPIPIREDVTVYVQGLPADLTEREAAKVGTVVLAFVPPEHAQVGAPHGQKYMHSAPMEALMNTPTTPETLARLDKLADAFEIGARSDWGVEWKTCSAGRDALAIRSVLAELSALREVCATQEATIHKTDAEHDALRAELARVAPLVEAAREWGRAIRAEAAEPAPADKDFRRAIYRAQEAVVDVARTFASQDEAG